MATGKTVKLFASALAAALIVAIGALSWMFYVGGEFQANVMSCIVDGLDEMEAEGDRAYTELMSSDGAKEVHTNLKDYGSFVLIFTLVPGVMCIVWLSFVVMCSCRTEDGRGYCWAKLFIFFSQFFLYLGVAFYVVIAALTYMLESGSLDNERKEFEDKCDEVVNSTRAELTQAEYKLDSLKNVGYTSPDEAAIRQNITEARGEISRVEKMCGCVHELVDNVTAFFMPSVVCVVIFVFVAFWVQLMCCKMGCICTNAGKKKPEKGVEFTSVAGADASADTKPMP